MPIDESVATTFYETARAFVLDLIDLSAYHSAVRAAAAEMRKSSEYAKPPLNVLSHALIQDFRRRAANDGRLKFRLSEATKKLVGALPPEFSGPPMAYG